MAEVLGLGAEPVALGAVADFLRAEAIGSVDWVDWSPGRRRRKQGDDEA